MTLRRGSLTMLDSQSVREEKAAMGGEKIIFRGFGKPLAPAASRWA